MKTGISRNLAAAACIALFTLCALPVSSRAQAAGPLPAPGVSPAPVPDVGVDPLADTSIPSIKVIPMPTKRDAQVIRDAMETQVNDPFSRTDLGFGIPRISAMKTVLVTLDFNPQILFQNTTVRGNSGSVQVQEGAFDTHITGTLSTNVSRNDRNIVNRIVPGASPVPTPFPNPLNARTGVFNYEIGLQKTLEDGIIINPSVSFGQNINNDYANQFNDANRGAVNFAVIIPLAKGAGTVVNKAPEIAARFDLLASVLQLRFITTQSVLNTIQAYWSCKAAEENYQLQIEAVQSAERLVTISTSLVQGDELAPAQLPQILADRSSAIAARIQAEAALISARQTLAAAMGLNADSLLLAPLTADAFPVPPRIERYPDARKLVFTALALRDDLRSVRETVKSRKALVDAAYLNLRPSINLQLLSSYVPLQTRTNISVTTGNTWQGGVALNFDWPVENNTAIGTYIQSQASYQNSKVSVDSTEITVVSGVITALAQLKAAGENVKLYRDSAQWYARALAAQEQLFQLGQGSLTDTITARQRAINAQASFITAQQSYANNLAQLRFATGTLFFSDRNGDWIDSGAWQTVPFISLSGTK